ncbi:MAG: glucose 1-dehydrogenase [Pseudomonadota bacterium]|nr:glucose 1-dehydrogenase [Pseudomonadota bacterium]
MGKQMQQSLAGRVALVTGAGNGMGRNHALVLASRGAAVIVLDRYMDAALETTSQIEGKCLAVESDVTDVAALQETICHAETDFGPVDILVNNAGIASQGLLIEDIDEATFDAMVAVNMKGSFFATQAVVPGMKERRYGKIINISSNFAMGGSAFGSHYAACKSALSGFVKSWARELAPWNIAVNAVAPGIIETDMTLSSIGKGKIDELADQIPMGRIGKPDDISWAVAWLASDETNFLTGQVISPNGGATIVGI